MPDMRPITGMRSARIKSLSGGTPTYAARGLEQVINWLCTPNPVV